MKSKQQGDRAGLPKPAGAILTPNPPDSGDLQDVLSALLGFGLALFPVLFLCPDFNPLGILQSPIAKSLLASQRRL